MSQYKDARIDSIRYFGIPKLFSAFDDNKIEETYNMYKTVIADSKVNNVKKISKEQFDKIN
jgi:predicted 3-demethylubiquinone-9 3-methyltransferase (glyoxalase superfamily)